MDLTTQRGYVYVLTNDSLPGLVKIGMTTRDPFRRAAELRSTGMPTSFEVAAAVLVDDPKRVESQLHRAFSAVRVKEDREFFQIDSASVLTILAEIVAQNPRPIPEMIDHNRFLVLDTQQVEPYKWELNLAWSFFFKRDLDDQIDIRLKRSQGEDFLEKLWQDAKLGNEDAQNELLELEEAGSPIINTLIFTGILDGSLSTDMQHFLAGIAMTVPERINIIMKVYPQHIQGFGEFYLKLTDINGTTGPRGRGLYRPEEPSYCIIILYSRDVILAGGLDPELFARQLGRHLELSQTIADDLAEILKAPWRVKALEAAKNPMQKAA